ncbi:type VI secretion system protein ImpA [Luteibacter rhizovicinus]|uniref:Type VI secretion system protein ImpA n=1 Tax=Luteibacter rhizovicinus TaxID=242606 RepID=A0A4R3Z0F3_9GAMM|nr:type VI secretion system ImpA family N-terminal domain-containing protein [Luteibacter rhizovicinus]TCV97294.1 type VI secretion system protein ImpA [Luteibacter rhizovicinus]
MEDSFDTELPDALPGAPDARSLIERMRTRDDGCDLESDADFVRLSIRIEGGVEVQYGDRVFAAPTVDWFLVETSCLELLERSNDLRVAVWLARAWLERHGLGGFAAGVQIVAFLLRERWPGMYPRLCEEDGDDPIARLNALAALATTDVLASLGRQRLPAHPLSTPLRLRDALSGRTTPEMHATLKLWGASIDVGQFHAFAMLLDGLIDDVVVAAHVLEHRAGGSALLEPLHHFLRAVSHSTASVAGASGPAKEDPDARDIPDAAPGTKAMPRGVMCASRVDVRQAMDAITGYYERCEPSSPVPLLIERARRLASQDFLGIVAELAPGNSAEFRHALGVAETP